MKINGTSSLTEHGESAKIKIINKTQDYERNQTRGESPANLCSNIFFSTINPNDMTKKMSTAEKRRAKRNAQIIELYEHCKDNFATQLERYLYIAERVGCSHITVYKVLRHQK